MADYSLNILRNETPIESKEAAIVVLDQFEDHMIGQPISLLYYNDNQEVRILFAIGKKNASDVQAGGEKCGPDFYDIIGESSGQVFWEEFQNTEIVPTTDPLRIAHAESETQFLGSHIEDNLLTIVNKKGIYKGDQLISPFRLEDMYLYENLEVNGDIYSGNIGDIISSIIENISKNIVCNLEWDDIDAALEDATKNLL